MSTRHRSTEMVTYPGCTIPGRPGPDYFDPPHEGRAPSDEAVRAQTARYVEAERKRMAGEV